MKKEEYFMKMFSELYPNGCSSTERDRLRNSWFQEYGNPYLEHLGVWSDEIWKLDSELSAISMLDSCFVYGGIKEFYKEHEYWDYCGAGSHYEHCLKDFVECGGTKEEFDKAIEAQKRYYDRCVVARGIYMDSEGNSYNGIREVK